MAFFRRNIDEHRWVQERLSLYLDGRLDPDERARVEAHLQVCASCARAWETLSWTVRALQALPRVPAPFSLAVRPEQVVPAPPRAGGLRWAAWAMAAAFILLLGLDLIAAGGRLAAPTSEVAPAGPAIARQRRQSEQAAPSPAPLFGLAVPEATSTPAPRAPEATPPPAPAPLASPVRFLELALLLGAIGLLALDRWRGRRGRLPGLRG